MKRGALALGIAVAAVLLLAPADRALAVCTPGSPVSNAQVTCTGSTSGFTTGYGSFADTGNTITVESGASVTGGSGGVIFSNGTVINNGTITGAALGVSGVTVTNVINFGTIRSTGNIGVNDAGGTANITNYGTITGPNAGVNAATANVTNFGAITSTNFNAIRANAANVTNSGTITGGNDGIFSATTASVSNSGTITGGSVGINVLATANVTNAGTISAPIAIQFGGVADTLTLLPGSTIIGAINLGSGDTINFNGGNHNLTFSSLAGATVTGTGIFAVSGNQAAAVDATQFAANGRVLGDFSRSVSQVVPDFGNQPAATGGPMGYAPSSPASVVSSAFDNMPGRDAYAADQAVFKAPTVVQADGTAIWARGFGGNRVQQADGVLLRTSSTFYGGALGFEKQVRYDLRVGAFVGAGTTRSQVELNTSNTDSTLGFGGIYARYFVGASFLYAAVQGGASHNDTTRNINNNLLAGGIETATGSYNGWYVSPELKLGHHIALGRVMDSSYTLTPSIGVRYLYGSFGGYTETGSTANLTVNSQTAQTVEERAELKLTRLTTFDARNALLLDITGGALGIQRVGSNIVNAALLGQSIPFATPGKDDVWGGFGGAGMEWRTANVSLFASAEYLWLSDSSTVVSGKGGVRVAF